MLEEITSIVDLLLAEDSTVTFVVKNGELVTK